MDPSLALARAPKRARNELPGTLLSNHVRALTPLETPQNEALRRIRRALGWHALRLDTSRNQLAIVRLLTPSSR